MGGAFDRNMQIELNTAINTVFDPLYMLYCINFFMDFGNRNSKSDLKTFEKNLGIPSEKLLKKIIKQ